VNLRPGLIDSLPSALAAQAVARFANQQITTAELLRSKLQQRSLQLYLGDSATSASVRSQLEAELGRLIEPRLLAYEEQRLPETNAEYRALADEYRDGLLMFNVMDQRVWRKAVEDSAGQRQFYAAHPDSFISGPRLRYLRIVGADSAEVAQRAAAVQQNPASATLVDSLVRIEWSPEPEAIAAARASAARVTPSVRKSASGWQAEALLGELPPARLPFAEAKLEVIRRYQNHLEAELNAELARRYPVSRNESVLSRVAR
jgi:peptidyl-prolyl cis-trans isomerase SurA